MGFNSAFKGLMTFMHLSEVPAFYELKGQLTPRILQSDTDFLWKVCLDIGVKHDVLKTTCLPFTRKLMYQFCDTVQIFVPSVIL